MAHQLSLPSTFSGFVVECRRHGSRLRVVPFGEGLLPWFVSFPVALRVDGARYCVERLKPTSRGYYRAAGQITRIADGK